MTTWYRFKADDGGGEIRVRIVPQTVPTTAAPFHASTTHIDAIGMPVASFVAEWDGSTSWYHPTPCCGAAASTYEGDRGAWYVGCKGCYAEIDPAYGNVPVAPFREISS